MEPQTVVQKMKSQKPKPPVIKQTLTSMYRLMKANPFLQLPENTPNRITDTKLKSTGSLIRKNLDKPATSTLTKPNPTNPTGLKRSQSLREHKSKPINSINKNLTTIVAAKKVNEFKKPLPLTKTKDIPQARPSRPQQKLTKPAPPRRSLSAQHYEKKIKAAQAVPKSPSTGNISGINELPKSSKKEPKTVTFKTPDKRFTLAHGFDRASRLFTSTPGPAPYDLQGRLSEWLKERPKRTSNFRHLKCFDVVYDKVVKSAENRENVDVKVAKSGSFEDLTGLVSEGKEENGVEDVEKVVKDALGDLQKLVIEDYPLDHCEEWLSLIRQKEKRIEEQPEYWECLAAMEERRGNIPVAVDHYKTAIVQGAEVKTVDESLENLLHKFSLLNIGPLSSKEEKARKDRQRIVLDARNVFKSSIIQFAIQERALKNNVKATTTTATPVRRSTRFTRTGYVKTPDIKLVSTLKNPEKLDTNITFKNNSFLSAKYN